MRFLLRAVKWLDRVRYALDLGLTRAHLRLEGFPQHRLEGGCIQCGRCCVRPSIQTNWLFYRLRSVRWLKLAWHWRVNGWELQEEVPELNAFVFRCTHFDAGTRQCLSYGSRPSMCRDYPRLTLYTIHPEVFEECGFRVVHRRAEAVRRKIDSLQLPPDQADQLKDALDLGED